MYHIQDLFEQRGGVHLPWEEVLGQVQVEQAPLPPPLPQSHIHSTHIHHHHPQHQLVELYFPQILQKMKNCQKKIVFV